MTARIDAVVDGVAKHFGLLKESLIAGRSDTRARRTAMFLARRLAGASFPQIARYFSDVRSTAVVAATVRIERDMADDAVFAAEVRKLEANLRKAADKEASA